MWEITWWSRRHANWRRYGPHCWRDAHRQHRRNARWATSWWPRGQHPRRHARGHSTHWWRPNHHWREPGWRSWRQAWWRTGRHCYIHQWLISWCFGADIFTDSGTLSHPPWTFLFIILVFWGAFIIVGMWFLMLSDSCAVFSFIFRGWWRQIIITINKYSKISKRVINWKRHQQPFYGWYITQPVLAVELTNDLQGHLPIANLLEFRQIILQLRTGGFVGATLPRCPCWQQQVQKEDYKR